VPVPVPVAVAEKVTGVPAHTVVTGLAAMVTAGVNTGFTAILIVLDVAEAAVKQVDPLILIEQVTISPLTSVEDVNVFAALVCTGLPLTKKV